MSLIESLKIYHRATEISSVVLDSEENKLDYVGNFNNDLLTYFDFDEVCSFASAHSKSAPDHSLLYTYFTKNNFFYYVLLVKHTSDYIIAGPITEKNRSSTVLSEYFDSLQISVSIKRELMDMAKKLPHVSLQQNDALCKLLYSHCCFLTDNTIPSPVTVGSSLQLYEHEREELQYTTRLSVFDDLIHAPVALFSELKEILLSGNLQRLDSLFTGMSNLPMDSLIEGDLIRSMKNNAIAGIGWISGLTIEYGAPYEHMLTTSDRFIRRIEKAETIQEILSVGKDAFINLIKAFHSFKNSAYSWQVTQALKYIKEHYTQKITLETLAELTDVSLEYLSSLINKETGCSIADHVHRSRIEESKQLLRNSSLPIRDIALLMGFSYQNYFAKWFKAIEGITPRDYRNQF